MPPAHTYTLDKFSTDLIVECILQHLETGVPTRPYGNHTEEYKKWLRLSETLVQCIRHDLRKYRTIDNAKMHLFSDRVGAATVVAHWYPDLNTLTKWHKEQFDNIAPQKEPNLLYIYLETLQQLAEPIFIRQNNNSAEDSDGKEVVFVFEQ